MRTPTAFKYGLFDEIYLRVAAEPKKGLIVALIQRPGALSYEVSWDDATLEEHYEAELSAEYTQKFDKE